MTFFGRRQSADSALRERMISYANGKELFMDAYSAAQFADCEANIAVTDDFSGVPDDSVCFIEDLEPESLLRRSDRLVIYRWNRNYPSETSFSFNPYEEGMKLERMSDFSGFSHPRITEEIWVRKTREVKDDE
jgi:hypothetical protein